MPYTELAAPATPSASRKIAESESNLTWTTANPRTEPACAVTGSPEMRTATPSPKMPRHASAESPSESPRGLARETGARAARAASPSSTATNGRITPEAVAATESSLGIPVRPPSWRGDTRGARHGGFRDPAVAGVQRGPEVSLRDAAGPTRQ